MEAGDVPARRAPLARRLLERGRGWPGVIPRVTVARLAAHAAWPTSGRQLRARLERRIPSPGADDALSPLPLPVVAARRAGQSQLLWPEVDTARAEPPDAELRAAATASRPRDWEGRATPERTRGRGEIAPTVDTSTATGAGAPAAEPFPGPLPTRAVVPVQRALAETPSPTESGSPRGAGSLRARNPAGAAPIAPPHADAVRPGGPSERIVVPGRAAAPTPLAANAAAGAAPARRMVLSRSADVAPPAVETVSEAWPPFGGPSAYRPALPPRNGMPPGGIPAPTSVREVPPPLAASPPTIIQRQVDGASPASQPPPSPPTVIQRQVDGASPASQPQPSPAAPPTVSGAASSGSGVDVPAVAQEVFRLLGRQLAAERERRAD